MSLALVLAGSGIGQTWPNPSVGCVVIKDDNIVATARTADGGRPHAESQAIAWVDATDATIYVTLEPCAHQGQTPPCANTLVKAGVREVVIGCVDPDPRVAGKGIEILRNAGINVVTGILENECREMNKGFFKFIEKGTPYVMLKAAISADGKYAEGNGAPCWVTGDEARHEVHRLRAEYDAIATGTGTILADNPRLDCRIIGLNECSPIKVVVGKREIPEDANIRLGKPVWHYPRLSLTDLADKGITRLMVEAGPTFSNALLKENAVDEIVIFQSARSLGENAKSFFEPNVLNNFEKISEEVVGEDKKMIFKKTSTI